ncbi:MAG: hypothetical protein JKX71_15505 [Amylibacter sp.]|nr:hypothetical protein [Amylibacter sp.]
MKRLHRLTAYILIVFVVIHLGNHLFLIAGRDTYNSVQKILNTVYRNPLLEPILIIAMIVQVIGGLKMAITSLRRLPKRAFWQRRFWEKAQIISGFVFAYFIIEHLIALAGVRWFNPGLETDFYWPASVMNGAPFTYYFVPYYFLGILAVMTHAGIGLRFVVQRKGKRRLGNILGIGSIILGGIFGVVIVLSLAGTFYDINLPPEWIDYLKMFYPDYAG